MSRSIFKLKRFWFGLTASILLTVFATFMIIDIVQKKNEALYMYPTLIQITDETDDPKIWGANFPHHYAMYIKTVDQTRTKYGGSEAVPYIPTDKDPRRQVSQSRLDEDPRLKVMWAGYAFSHDFREERGHAYMLEDQLYTKRHEVTNQPGACLNCHASTYNYMKSLGDGDIHKGFEKMNALPYFEAVKNVKHPVSCIDCHTPQTMTLRVTRPAFMEGIKKVKALEGISEFEVNRDATPQQMRTFVCAQCHVEYYFKGDTKQLTFPWNKGLRGDDILKYYEETGHIDWKHKLSDAGVLKAQHPEFELYSQGIHARSGVSCVDCHMPYTRQGAMKISDHHIQSPTLNINRACQTCHSWPEAELKARIETIQDRTYEVRGVALDALDEYIKQLAESKDSLKDKEALKKAQNFQKKAQFLVDFIEAENSMGFHAPEEALRLLGLSIDYTRQGQGVLHKALLNEKPKSGK